MSHGASGLEIAIIGMSCHFPGAPTLEAFLDNLRRGVESISFFSEEEARQAGIGPELLRNPAFVRAGAVLDGFESFDAEYFGYTPRDAELIDPQQRLFLERAVEALERAGYDADRFEGTIGVYAGMGNSGYAALLAANPRLRGLVDGFQLLIGNDRDFLASRVAYKLNLQGPAVGVQTACSTSLAAVHVACQALLSGDCDMALAGGVSVRVPHRTGYLFQEEGIVSSDGHCRPFDADADGTVPGSGVGIVVLRRLSDALADGDAIEAIIRGSAINNDGAKKLGYTAPRIEGQARVIRSALAMAQVEAASIGYVEAHGTATALGDPVEIAALNQVLGREGPRRCALGSVKGNFGHLDAAAGVAGLIKAALSVRHKQIFPSLNFQKPNPKIDFAGGPLYVNTVLADWPRNGGPRRAGVSSFGMGGTNVHVVVEEAPEPVARAHRDGPQLVVLSARSEAALAQVESDLAAHLAVHAELDLADVARTLARGRRELRCRAAFAADSLADAARLLADGARGRIHRARVPEASAPVAFLFTGQGSQQVGMAEALYSAEPAFRRQIDACCDGLRTSLGLDLRRVLYPAPEDRAAAEESLLDTELAQPALFAVEYALARLWMDWGVTPQSLAGHSLGEYVAACLAGVLTLDDALALVAERGKLVASCAPGAMLAVAGPSELLPPLLDDGASLAAANAPELSVIAGPLEAVERWQRRLELQGIACRRLRTSHAFHSPAVDPILARFHDRVARVALRPPTIPFISGVTGTWITAQQATDPGYWTQQLRETVQFGKAVAELLREPRRILLEVGPGDTLASIARRQMPPGCEAVAIASLGGDRPGQDALRAMLDAAAQLWTVGAGLDPAARAADAPGRRVSLPTYPFERRRFWLDARAAAEPESRPLPAPPRDDVAEWFYVPSWRRVAPAPRAQRLEAGPFCVFADGRGVAAAVVDRLRATGADVVVVGSGAAFERRGLGSYVLDPADPDHYRRLVQELAREGRRPRRIVHLWGVDEAGPGGDQPAAVRRELDHGFFSLLHTAQALGALEAPDVHLSVVTAGAEEVTAGEDLHPSQAAALSALRVVAMEYPQTVCRAIDLDVAGFGVERGAGGHADAVDLLLAELLSEANDALIALRGPYRWAPAFEAVSLPALGGRPGRLRERGVYLITGGFGGIGLALAEHLATAFKARLVLVSRTGLPDRRAWADLIRVGADQRLTGRIRAVERLEAAGAEVLVAAADVAVREQMASVLEEAERRFGALHGVIHAAGVPGGGLVQLKTRSRAADVLAPKVGGTLVLHDLVRSRPLDFMVLCSSLAAVRGAPGQVDYAAANAFLDGFAQASRRRGPVTVSIAWDTWKEAGMAVEVELPPALSDRRAELLAGGLSAREGVEVFRRALDAGFARVLVSKRPLADRFAESARPPAANAPPRPRPTASVAHPRPSLRNEYIAPRTELERALAEAWQQLLGIDAVGVGDNFFELGGESLGALRLVGLLKERRGLPVSLVRLYESPTIEGLARHLEGTATGPSLLDESGRRGEARAGMMAQRRQSRAR